MPSADNRHSIVDDIDLSLLSVAPNTASGSRRLNLDSPVPSSQEGKSDVHLALALGKEAVAELSTEQLAIVFSFLSPEDTVLARVVCPKWRDAAMTSCISSEIIAGVDNIKLKCEKEHLEKDETISKERVAELREELLFRQPENSHLGDCPICFLPMPLDDDKSGISPCCCKMVCKGCVYANLIREIEQRLKHKCPFCRKEVPKTDEEDEKLLMKRVNDPAALRQIGMMHYKERDYDSAIEYWTRAAEMGDAISHCNLADRYHEGDGVEKDEERAIYHLEEAAIAGHPHARYNLGYYEWRDGKYDRAVKHLIIAANLGHDNSLHMLKEVYKAGHVSKDDLASALRAHQAAVDAMKSPQRQRETKEIFNSFAQRVSKDDLEAALRAHQAAVDATKSPQREAAPH